MSAIAGSSNQQEFALLRDQLGKSAAKAMYEMVSMSEEAKQSKSLDRGIWYPHEYAYALRDSGQQQRIAQFYRLNAFAWGYANQDYFSAPLNGRAWALVGRSDKLPAETVKAAMKGLSIIECGSACVIAQYKALLDVIGEEKFNKIFAESPINLRYDGQDAKGDVQPMQYFVDFTDVAKAAARGAKAAIGELSKRPVKVGQTVLILGVKDYQKKHFGGMDASYNLICSDETPGKQRFLGHGLPKEGATEEEVGILLAKGYNAEPDHVTRNRPEEHHLLPAEIKSRGCDSFKNHKVKPKNASVVGYNAASPQDFKLKVIDAIVKAPLAEVSLTFVKLQSKS